MPRERCALRIIVVLPGHTVANLGRRDRKRIWHKRRQSPLPRRPAHPRSIATNAVGHTCCPALQSHPPRLCCRRPPGRANVSCARGPDGDNVNSRDGYVGVAEPILDRKGGMISPVRLVVPAGNWPYQILRYAEPLQSFGAPIGGNWRCPQSPTCLPLCNHLSGSFDSHPF